MLAKHALSARTSVEAARGWAEAYVRDHFGTAMTMHFEKNAGLRVTVFEVLVPDCDGLAARSLAEGVVPSVVLGGKG